MKHKLLTLVLAVVVITSLVIAGCAKPAPTPSPAPAPAPVPSEKVYQWKLGMLFPEQGMPIGERAYTFADLVQERTNGQIKIQVFPVQQLGDWKDEFDNVMKGTQEMGILPHSPRYDELGACTIPFTITDWDAYHQAYDRGNWLCDYFDKCMADRGIEQLAVTNPSFDGYSGMKGPVVYPEDIKKLGIATRIGYPNSSIYYSKLGPVREIDFGETFTSLQTGVIDCQADMMIFDVYLQFHDVTKYFTDVNSNEAPIWIGLNKDLYDSLTPDLQKVLRDTAVEVSNIMTKECQEEEEDFYQKFVDEGVVVTRLTKEQRQKWIELATKPGGAWDELAKQSPTMAGIIDMFREHLS